jgi:hypothetical protein
VKRILSEHPESEHHHIVKGDRLLSILAPLRSDIFQSILNKNTLNIVGDKSPGFNSENPDMVFLKHAGYNTVGGS